MSENKELSIQENKLNELAENVDCYGSEKGFALAQRMAVSLSKTTLVPKDYQNNVANCMIALDVANRMRIAPLVVTQNLHIINSKPSWSSTFTIAQINCSPKFKGALQFKAEGEIGKDNRTCTAFIANKDGSILEGTPVSIAMAKAEGWYGKPGSKWPNMPEQMLRYRAAAFFARLYCPEVLMGLQTADEIYDVVGEVVETEDINKALNIEVKSEPEIADIGVDAMSSSVIVDQDNFDLDLGLDSNEA